MVLLYHAKVLKYTLAWTFSVILRTVRVLDQRTRRLAKRSCRLGATSFHPANRSVPPPSVSQRLSFFIRFSCSVPHNSTMLSISRHVSPISRNGSTGRLVA
jgi:hypothetical protein